MLIRPAFGTKGEKTGENKNGEPVSARNEIKNCQLSQEKKNFPSAVRTMRGDNVKQDVGKERDPKETPVAAGDV